MTDDAEPTGSAPQGPEPAPTQEPSPEPSPDPAETPESERPLVPWEPGRAASGAPAAGLGAGARVGTGARLVAWFLDALVVGLAPAGLILYALAQVWAPFLRTVVPGEPPDAAAVQAMTAAIAPYAAGAQLFGAAIAFVYFVGLWTSESRRTLGMRVVRFRIADDATGGPLTLGQAVRRWAAMGFPLAILASLPVDTLASLGALQPLWQLVLLITVASDARGRGLHDTWAGSRMEPVDGAPTRAGLGCIVLFVLYVAFTVAFVTVLGVGIAAALGY